MSRSRRHTAIAAHLMVDSEKDDKRKANRHHRRLNRMVLHVAGDETAMRQLREVSNPYAMDKDGKRRFDPVADPAGMRK